MNRLKGQPYGFPRLDSVRPVRENLMKRCTLCGNEYPATTEYFTRDKGNKDGLRPQCKVCYRLKQKEWRHADPDRYVDYARDQYLKDPEKIKRRVKVYQQTPRAKESQRKYRERNKPALKIRDREYYRENRGRIMRRVTEWQQGNPEKRQAIRQRYAARRATLPANFTDADWQTAVDYFGGCCAACGRPPGLFHTLAADHWVPLASPDCPGTFPSNIIPLCHGEAGCNNAKQDRDAQEWLVSRFGKRQAQKISENVQGYFSWLTKAK